MRSSSYNRLDWCEHLYYIEYVLGLTGYSGKSAEAGNFIHKSMEILALIKKARQDGIQIIHPENMDGFEIDIDNFNLDNIFVQSCAFYLKKSPHSYTQAELKKYREWLDIALNYKNGLYNPLNCEIVGVEKSFDIEFNEDWAKYEYELNGEKFSGRLGIKGNVDIITKYSDNIVTLLDYKTGQRRKDWGDSSKAKKEFKDFLKDPQLKIYYYALAHLYPDKDIIISIYYINDGGVFSIPFERNQLPEIRDMLRKRFERIKTIEIPSLLDSSRRDWRCKNLCHAAKTMVGSKSLCEHIHKEINRKGMQKATEDNIKEGFDPRLYADGGGGTGLKEKDLK